MSGGGRRDIPGGGKSRYRGVGGSSSEQKSNYARGKGERHHGPMQSLGKLGGVTQCMPLPVQLESMKSSEDERDKGLIISQGGSGWSNTSRDKKNEENKSSKQDKKDEVGWKKPVTVPTRPQGFQNEFPSLDEQDKVPPNPPPNNNNNKRDDQGRGHVNETKESTSDRASWRHDAPPTGPRPPHSHSNHRSSNYHSHRGDFSHGRGPPPSRHYSSSKNSRTNSRHMPYPTPHPPQPHPPANDPYNMSYFDTQSKRQQSSFDSKWSPSTNTTTTGSERYTSEEVGGVRGSRPSKEEEDEDEGWAGHHEDIDYSKEVVFEDSSDEDDHKRKETPPTLTSGQLSSHSDLSRTMTSEPHPFYRHGNTRHGWVDRNTEHDLQLPTRVIKKEVPRESPSPNKLYEDLTPPSPDFDSASGGIPKKILIRDLGEDDTNAKQTSSDLRGNLDHANSRPKKAWATPAPPPTNKQVGVANYDMQEVGVANYDTKQEGLACVRTPSIEDEPLVLYDISDRGPICSDKTLYEPEGKTSQEKFRKYHRMSSGDSTGHKGGGGVSDKQSDKPVSQPDKPVLADSNKPVLVSRQVSSPADDSVFLPSPVDKPHPHHDDKRPHPSLSKKGPKNNSPTFPHNNQKGRGQNDKQGGRGSYHHGNERPRNSPPPYSRRGGRGRGGGNRYLNRGEEYYDDSYTNNRQRQPKKYTTQLSDTSSAVQRRSLGDDETKTETLIDNKQDTGTERDTGTGWDTGSTGRDAHNTGRDAGGTRGEHKATTGRRRSDQFYDQSGEFKSHKSRMKAEDEKKSHDKSHDITTEFQSVKNQDSSKKHNTKTQDTTRPVSKPQDTTSTVSKPQDTTRPVSKPQDTTRPVSKPQDTTRPVSKPQDTTRQPRPISKPQDTTRQPQDTTRQPQDTTRQPQETTRPVSKPQDTTRQPQDTTRPVNKPQDTTRQPQDTTRPVNKPQDTTRQPQETTRPVSKPQETTRPVSKPQDTTRPVSKPQDTTRPVSKPQDTTRPVSKPQDTTRPVIKPQDTTRQPQDTTSAQSEHNKPGNHSKPHIKSHDHYHKYDTYSSDEEQQDYRQYPRRGRGNRGRGFRRSYHEDYNEQTTRPYKERSRPQEDYNEQTTRPYKERSRPQEDYNEQTTRPYKERSRPQEDYNEQTTRPYKERSRPQENYNEQTTRPYKERSRPQEDYNEQTTRPYKERSRPQEDYNEQTTRPYKERSRPQEDCNEQTTRPYKEKSRPQEDYNEQTTRPYKERSRPQEDYPFPSRTFNRGSHGNNRRGRGRGRGSYKGPQTTPLYYDDLDDINSPSDWEDDDQLNEYERKKEEKKRIKSKNDEFVSEKNKERESKEERRIDGEREVEGRHEDKKERVRKGRDVKTESKRDDWERERRGGERRREIEHDRRPVRNEREERKTDKRHDNKEATTPLFTPSVTTPPSGTRNKSDGLLPTPTMFSHLPITVPPTSGRGDVGGDNEGFITVSKKDKGKDKDRKRKQEVGGAQRFSDHTHKSNRHHEDENRSSKGGGEKGGASHNNNNNRKQEQGWISTSSKSSQEGVVWSSAESRQEPVTMTTNETWGSGRYGAIGDRPSRWNTSENNSTAVSKDSTAENNYLLFDNSTGTRFPPIKSGELQVLSEAIDDTLTPQFKTNNNDKVDSETSLDPMASLESKPHPPTTTPFNNKPPSTKTSQQQQQGDRKRQGNSGGRRNQNSDRFYTPPAARSDGHQKPRPSSHHRSSNKSHNTKVSSYEERGGGGGGEEERTTSKDKLHDKDKPKRQQQHQRGGGQLVVTATNSVAMSTNTVTMTTTNKAFSVSQDVGVVTPSVKFGTVTYATALKNKMKGEERNEGGGSFKSGQTSQGSSRVTTPEEKEAIEDVLPIVMATADNVEMDKVSFPLTNEMFAFINSDNTASVSSPCSPVGVVRGGVTGRSSLPASPCTKNPEIRGVSPLVSDFNPLLTDEPVLIYSGEEEEREEEDEERENITSTSDVKSSHQLNITAHEFIPHTTSITNTTQLGGGSLINTVPTKHLPLTPPTTITTSKPPLIISPASSSQQSSLLSTPPQLVHLLHNLQYAVLNASVGGANNKRGVAKFSARPLPTAGPIPLTFPPQPTGQGTAGHLMMTPSPHPPINYSMKPPREVPRQLHHQLRPAPISYIDRNDGIHGNLAPPVHTIIPQTTPTMPPQGTLVQSTLPVSAFPPAHMATPTHLATPSHVFVQPIIGTPHMPYQQIGHALPTRTPPISTPTPLHVVDPKATPTTPPNMRPPLLPTPPNFNLLVGGAMPMRPVATPTSMFPPPSVWPSNRMPSSLNGSGHHMISSEGHAAAMQHQII